MTSFFLVQAVLERGEIIGMIVDAPLLGDYDMEMCCEKRVCQGIFLIESLL